MGPEEEEARHVPWDGEENVAERRDSRGLGRPGVARQSRDSRATTRSEGGMVPGAEAPARRLRRQVLKDQRARSILGVIPSEGVNPEGIAWFQPRVGAAAPTLGGGGTRDQQPQRGCG